MAISIPDIQPVASLQLQEVDKFELDNGINIFGFNGANNDVLKIDLVFNSGRWTESKPLQALFCSGLIKSGNAQRSAYVISESIDFLGSTISASSGYNSFSLHLYCLTRHLESCLKLLIEILNDTSFPENEIKLKKAQSLSALKTNQLKNDYVADMIFKEQLYGSNHPYGYKTTEHAIQSIHRADLLAYYKGGLSQNICYICVAGKYAQKEIDLLNRYLGNNDNWNKSKELKQPNWEIKCGKNKKIETRLPNSVQASLFIGNISIERKHKDYFTFALLNMIYGGYFGSRLMSNLREDKGLTYGVYSYNQNFKYSSAFIINTETAIEHVNRCLKEIYFEMTRLKEELIPEEELNMARNYLLGRLLDQVDGPFKSASTFLGLKGHGLTFDYLKNMENKLNNINPKQLLNCAQQYLEEEDLFEVVVK